MDEVLEAARLAPARKRHRHQQARVAHRAAAGRAEAARRASPASSAATRWRSASPIPCRCCTPRPRRRRARGVHLRGRRASATCRPRTPPGCRRWSRTTAISARTRIRRTGAPRATRAAARSLGLARRARARMSDGGSGLRSSPVWAAARSAPWRRSCGARSASSAMQVELEVLRARLKSEESAGREREQRARAGARAIAGRVRRAWRAIACRATARCSCSSRASAWRASSRMPPPVLKERETAIESMVQPIREALAQDRSADPEHRARAHRCLRHHQEPDGGAGERPEPAVARDAQSGHCPAPPRRARPMGRDHFAPLGGVVRHERACGFHRAAASDHRLRRRYGPT